MPFLCVSTCRGGEVLPSDGSLFVHLFMLSSHLYSCRSLAHPSTFLCSIIFMKVVCPLLLSKYLTCLLLQLIHRLFELVIFPKMFRQCRLYSYVDKNKIFMFTGAGITTRLRINKTKQQHTKHCHW